MIKQVGKRWCLFTKDGSKKLFCHSDKAVVERRMRQVEHFASSMHSSETTQMALSVIPLPVMPSTPTKTIRNQALTQEMIDGTLAYDPEFREAKLYLVKDEKDDAHRRKGMGNKAVVGRFNKKPYIKDGHVYLDAEIQKLTLDSEKQKQFEKEIMLMVSAQGGYPERSVDLMPKSLVPNATTNWVFEGLALCGTNRMAIPNLPKLDFENLLELNQMQSFTINFDTQKEKNEMTPEEVQAMLDKQKKEMQDLMAVAIKDAVNENTKTLTASFSQQTEQIKKKVDANKQGQVEAWCASQTIAERVPSTLIDNVKNIRLILADIENKKVSFSVVAEDKQEKEDLSLEDAFVKLIESFNPMAKFSKDGEGMAKKGDLQSTLTGEKKIEIKDGEIKLRGRDDSEKRLNLVKDMATKLNLKDIFMNPESFKKAELEAVSFAQKSEDEQVKYLFGDSELGLR